MRRSSAVKALLVGEQPAAAAEASRNPRRPILSLSDRFIQIIHTISGEE
jgi:hypothetical protein